MNLSYKKTLARYTSIHAVFGGTFDPPHLGHLKPLQQVMDSFDLPQMNLMPANQPALKGKVTAIQHRLEMTKLLCELDNRLKIDTTEITKGGQTYTVETLAHLKQEKPDTALVFVIGLDSLRNIEKWYRYEELFDYAHIVVMCRDVEMPHPLPTSISASNSTEKTSNNKLAPYLYNLYTSERKFDRLIGPEMDDKVRSLLLSKLALNDANLRGVNPTEIKDIILQSVEGKLWFVNNNIVPISSTEIRQRIKLGKDASEFLPKSVSDYIVQHNLYI